ncbi:MAG TPA: PfkB family carbohydrate kinase [Sporichthya sp.]|nr:PfkB family carbohydrate kinase [Sporichthya sp.]
MGECEVCVVGSANLDVVLGVAAIPGPGETVLARTRTSAPGGKGANQAVAAARSGAATAFVAVTGADDAAQVLRAELAQAGVALDALRTSASPTGTAYVVVDEAGENTIVVEAGANRDLTNLLPGDVELARRSRVVLCQLEVPEAAVAQALAAAGGRSVLNAAPARPLPPALLSSTDLLIVNEHEARIVAGLSGGAGTPEEAVPQLLEWVPEVIVTLGAAGALVAARGAPPTRVPAVPARRVVDTTGAGDTFCGAFAAELARGAGVLAAARWGCAAASLAVERPGAAVAVPSRAEVLARLGGPSERG